MGHAPRRRGRQLALGRPAPERAGCTWQRVVADAQGSPLPGERACAEPARATGAAVATTAVAAPATRHIEARQLRRFAPAAGRAAAPATGFRGERVRQAERGVAAAAGAPLAVEAIWTASNSSHRANAGRTTGRSPWCLGDGFCGGHGARRSGPGRLLHTHGRLVGAAQHQSRRHIQQLVEHRGLRARRPRRAHLHHHPDEPRCLCSGGRRRGRDQRWQHRQRSLGIRHASSRG